MRAALEGALSAPRRACVPWKLSDVWTVSARCCTRCLHAQRLSGRFSTPTGVLAFLDQLHPCGRSTYLPTWLADARIDRSARDPGDDHRAGREHRPLDGTRRAGLCSSGLPSADRHLTEGVPCRLAWIVNVSDGDGHTRRQIMRPRYGHRSPAPTQGEEPLRDPARLSAWTRVPGSLAKP